MQLPIKLIIAALSARAYARAAKDCGFDVIALDAFADTDTYQVAAQTFKIKMNAQDVNAEDFKYSFSQINIDEVEGFLYGSLFDNAPDLLTWVAARVRLLGNSPTVMQTAKSYAFFKLLDELHIKHPEVSLVKPLNPESYPESWLSKQIGGTGGTHVKPAAQGNAGDYYQRKIDGIPVSMLFAADGKSVQIIGFNQQFIAPTVEMPYRFAGAVNNIVMQPNINAAFKHAAQQLTIKLGLRGINSLDAILKKNSADEDELWILELNPRLCATFHLYENLLPLHLHSCAGDLKDFASPLGISKAQLILYADKALEITDYFVWPEWVADIPAIEGAASSVKITENSPICSVRAEGETASIAHTLVLQRAEKLRGMLMQ